MSLTFWTFLVTFLGTGIFKLDALYLKDNQYTMEHNRIILECNKANLTQEQKDLCYKVLIPLK